MTCVVPSACTNTQKESVQAAEAKELLSQAKEKSADVYE